MPLNDPANRDAQNPGAMLRAARDAAGLSVAEVAHRLKLTERFVEVIETNDRQRFQPVAYMRGYLRNYARLLDIDPAPLLAALAVEPSSAPSPDSVEGRRRKGGSLALTLTMAVIGLIIAALLFVVWQRSAPENGTIEGADPAPPSSVVEPAATAESPTGVREAASQEILPGGDVAGVAGEGSASGEIAPAAGAFDEEVSPGAVSPAPGLQPIGAEEPVSPGSVPNREAAAGVVSETGPGESSMPAEAAGPAPASEPSAPRVARELLRVRRITPFGDDELWFEFAEDCWVEVYDMNELLRYEDLLRRRQSLRLVGEGPFRIRLGYAVGVTLEYNGERIPLGPHTRDNVATLVVGQ